MNHIVKVNPNIDENRLNNQLLISYELRSSLNIISLSSKFLLDYFKDDIRDCVIKYIKSIYDTSKMKTNLLENFLNTSALESRRSSLKLKNENISNIIENCV